jgi:HSP20 family protein
MQTTSESGTDVRPSKGQSVAPPQDGGSAPDGQTQRQQGGEMQAREGSALARQSQNPLTMLQRLSDEMDELFGSLFYGRPLRRQGRSEVALLWAPEVELSEQDHQLRVRVDLPGVSKDDIHVDVQDRVLVIEGERREERSEADEQRGWRRTERRYGNFYRAIPLPDGADGEKAEARMKDGVLEITVPLSENKSSRRLDIKQ